MKQLFGDTMPSSIKYPFSYENIKGISMSAQRNPFTVDGEFNIYGSVEFKNGNTEGKQRFRANSLGELFEKIAKFCMSLQ